LAFWYAWSAETLVGISSVIRCSILFESATELPPVSGHFPVAHRRRRVRGGIRGLFRVCRHPERRRIELPAFLAFGSTVCLSSVMMTGIFVRGVNTFFKRKCFNDSGACRRGQQVRSSVRFNSYSSTALMKTRILCVEF
jgi:hypothetical protein